MEQTAGKISANGKDTASKAANIIGSKVGDFISDASEGVKNATDSLTHTGQQIAKTYQESVRTLETSVKKYPMRSVLIAGGVGLAAGTLISFARGLKR